MTLSLHTLNPGRRVSRSARRVGRGNASQKGTTAGKGTKGQKARTGGRGGLKVLGLRRTLMKVPKNRGFKSMYAKPELVNLTTLERVAVTNQTITPVWLAKRKIVSTINNGVKIVASGKLTKAVTVQGCLASKGAVAAIEKTGGKVVF